MRRRQQDVGASWNVANASAALLFHHEACRHSICTTAAVEARKGHKMATAPRIVAEEVESRHLHCCLDLSRIRFRSGRFSSLSGFQCCRLLL